MIIPDRIFNHKEQLHNAVIVTHLFMQQPPVKTHIYILNKSLSTSANPMPYSGNFCLQLVNTLIEKLFILPTVQ